MYITKTAMDEPWTPGDVRPCLNISISPAADYRRRQGLFEGMKSFTKPLRGEFVRPEKKMRRMQRRR